MFFEQGAQDGLQRHDIDAEERNGGDEVENKGLHREIRLCGLGGLRTAGAVG